MVLSILTSSPADAGTMLPVYYREWLRAQEGADDSTLQVRPLVSSTTESSASQILGNLLTLLEETMKNNGVAYLKEVHCIHSDV